MSVNNTYLDSKNYLNMQGIGQLKGQSTRHPGAVKHEVAQQFESMLVQMLLKSMRDASKVFTDNKESDSGSEMYQDLFDKQVALSMSVDGLGLGKNIENYLGNIESQVQESAPIMPTVKADMPAPIISPIKKESEPTLESKTESDFSDEWGFVKSLWGHAKKAAMQLGVDPKLLVAQAALETGWGKKVIASFDKGNSRNLFNIKADGRWEKDAIKANTLEEKGGVIARENASFRAYSSYAESFDDYVDFIKSNPRYQSALAKADNPSLYMKELQQANYATDSNYSNKVMEIYKGDRLKNILEKAELV